MYMYVSVQLISSNHHANPLKHFVLKSVFCSYIITCSYSYLGSKDSLSAINFIKSPCEPPCIFRVGGPGQANEQPPWYMLSVNVFYSKFVGLMIDNLINNEIFKHNKSVNSLLVIDRDGKHSILFLGWPHKALWIIRPSGEREQETFHVHLLAFVICLCSPLTDSKPRLYVLVKNK